MRTCCLWYGIMKYSNLGKTGIKVSELGLGALTIGYLQANLPLDEGAAVIKHALSLGVNFIDTAELYETYEYIRVACGEHSDVVLSSKSYAYSYEGMRDSVQLALESTGRKYIDIFSLHEQTSRLTLKGHSEALRYLQEAKAAGLVRAIGVSTHTVEVVRAAAMYDEIDIIHPIINMRGLGIVDGTVEQMLEAIEFAAYMGKGLYAMKALAGGHLSGNYHEAIDWIRGVPAIGSTVIGMQNIYEVEANAALFNGQLPSQACADKLAKQVRTIRVEECCVGCGRCVEACGFGNISIEGGKCVIDTESCVRCAYCAAKCPQFSIKVF